MQRAMPMRATALRVVQQQQQQQQQHLLLRPQHLAMRNARIARGLSASANQQQTSTPPPPPQDDKDKQQQEQQQQPSPLTALLARLRELKVAENVQAAVGKTKERLFAKDETTWKDAFRSAIGLKPEAKSGADEDEAFKKKTTTTTSHKASAKSASGASPSSDSAGRTQTPEEEAKEFLKSQQEQGPSLYEIKLKELGEAIRGLENEREEAQNQGDMAKFKDLNKKVREVRKEMESVQEKMNSTSVVQVEERKSAWETFGETLKEAPLLRGIFGLGESQAAKKISDAAEGAREVWETSQHPLVYRLQSAWDSVFAETEMGEAIREFRKIDPDFTMEGFLEQAEDRVIPTVISAFLREDLATLDKYLGEAAFAAVKAHVDERKRMGRKMDPNLLNIQHVQVAAAKVVDKQGPMIVLQFMAQQVDCLYDNAGLVVVEGSNDKVAAVFYAFAMTRERNEDTGALKWSIKEFAMMGSVPWI